MKLVLKDGTVLEALDSSYGNNYIFPIENINEIVILYGHFTANNLSSFTVDGTQYTDYELDNSGSWGNDTVMFSFHKKSEIEYMKDYISDVIEGLPDEQAMNVPSLFDSWKVGTAYTIGNRVSYNGVLYKCLQSHTSQSDWAPEVAVSLWTKVTVEEWPEWVQPTGAHDAYAKDAKVTYNGKHYISNVDANVWAPPTQWTEV